MNNKTDNERKVHGFIDPLKSSIMNGLAEVAASDTPYTSIYYIETVTSTQLGVEQNFISAQFADDVYDALGMTISSIDFITSVNI